MAWEPGFKLRSFWLCYALSVPLSDQSIPQSNPVPPTPTTIQAGPGALALTPQQALCAPSLPEIGALTHLWGDVAQALVFSDRHVVLLTPSRLSPRTRCCFYFRLEFNYKA